MKPFHNDEKEIIGTMRPLTVPTGQVGEQTDSEHGKVKGKIRLKFRREF